MDYFLKRFPESTARRRRGRPRKARTVENIDTVDESVPRTMHNELSLQCAEKRMHAQQTANVDCATRVIRAKQLLNKFPLTAVDFIFFTDEKLFTVASPVNLRNNRVYGSCGIKKRLLHPRSTLSESVMVSVAVSKLGCTELIFVEPDVEVDSVYYCDMLSQRMLPAIRRIAGDVYVFQLDGAPAHRAPSTIEFLRRETPDFISPDAWPPNCPGLNPVEYKIWRFVQERVYKKPIHDLAELKQRLVDVWADIEQTVIDKAVKQWRHRLRTCVRTNGKYFEHLL